MHQDNAPDPDIEAFLKTLEPKGPLDRFFHWLYLREKRSEQTGVVEPERLRHLFRYDMAIFALLVTTVILRSALSPGLLDTTAGVVGGAIVGMHLLRTTRRARAYQRGWLDGRKQMIASMEEAMRRDINMQDWLHGEIERDLWVMRHL